MTTPMRGFGAGLPLFSRAEPSYEFSSFTRSEYVDVTAEERLQNPDVDLSPAGASLSADFLCRFTDVLYALGASRSVCISAYQNIRRVTFDPDEEKFVSKTKAFCASFTAKILGTPGGAWFPMKGHFGRWVNAHLVRGRMTRARKEICESLFVGTKLMGHSTDWLSHQSIRKHQAKTNSTEEDGSFTPYLQRLADSFYSPLYKYMREVGEKPSEFNVASSNGSVQSSRKLQGKAGWLVRTFHGVRETHPMLAAIELAERQDEGPPLIPIEETRSRSADFQSRIELADGTVQWKTKKAQRFDHSWPEEPDNGCLVEEPKIVRKNATVLPSGHFVTPTEYDYPVTRSRWQGHVIREALLEMTPDSDGDWTSRHVKYTVIKEAGCKNRGVTKGAAACATVAQNWQQHCFNGMKKLYGRFFPSLSGKITALEIARLYVPGGVMRSSDFQAATDELTPSLTNHLLINLTQGWATQPIILDDNADKVVHYQPIPVVYQEPPKHWVRCLTRNVYYRVLTKKEVEKKKIDGRRIFVIKIKFGDVVLPVEGCALTSIKRCGQLMGQATSFPLLCLVNLLVSFAAYCVAERHLPRDFDRWQTLDFRVFDKSVKRAIGRFSCIINGDDRLRCSLAASEEEKIFWALASSVGLKRSPGKSHESPEFAVINAQRYGLHRGEWVRLSVLRSNLLFGIKKLDSERFCPAEVITALFETCSFAWQERVIKLFLSKHGEQLDRDLAGRNLFLPLALGGMGQEKPALWVNTIDPQQRAVAIRLYHGTPNLDYNFGPKQAAMAPAATAQSFPWDLPTAVPFMEEGDRPIWNQPMESLNSYKSRVKYNRGCPTKVRIREVRCPMGHWYSGTYCRHWNDRYGVCGLQGTVCSRARYEEARATYCPYNCVSSWERAAGFSCECGGSKTKSVSRRICDCHGVLSPIRHTYVERAPPDLEALSAPRLVLSSRADSVHIRDEVAIRMKTWGHRSLGERVIARSQDGGAVRFEKEQMFDLEPGDSKTVRPYLDVGAVAGLFASGGVVLPPVGGDGI